MRTHSFHSPQAKRSQLEYLFIYDPRGIIDTTGYVLNWAKHDTNIVTVATISVELVIARVPTWKDFPFVRKEMAKNFAIAFV